MRKRNISKRFLAVLLACLMVISICPTAVFAVEETDPVTTEQTMEGQVDGPEATNSQEADKEEPAVEEDGEVDNSSTLSNADKTRTTRATTSYRYIDENGNMATIGADEPVHIVESTDHRWTMQDGKPTWYIVNQDVTINGGVDISNTGSHIKLLLMDGVTLTINGRNENGGLWANGDTISIYAQSNGPDMGKLIANAGHYNWMAIGGDGAQIKIYGGHITAEGDGMSGIGGDGYNRPYSLTIHGGLVETSSIGRNRDSTLGEGCSGIYAQEGSNAIIYVNQAGMGYDIAGTITDTFKSGILFLRQAGTVYGNTELPMNLTIKENETLTIPYGKKLTIPQGKTLTVEGMLVIEGTLVNNGTVTTSGSGMTKMTLGSQYTGTKPRNLQHQIGWDYNGDGIADDTEYVLHGAKPTHETPSKEATVDKEYVFTGWLPAINSSTTVTQPTTYSAQFTEWARLYTVTWSNLPEGCWLIVTDSSSSATSMQVGYNEIFEFKIAISNGYTTTKEYGAKANGNAIQRESFFFRVPITEDTEISVDGIVKVVESTINDDITISEGSVMTIEDHMDVTLNGTLTVNGTLNIDGIIRNNGTIICNGTINNSKRGFINLATVYMNLGSSYTGIRTENVSYEVGWDTDGDGEVESRNYVKGNTMPSYTGPINKEPTIEKVFTFSHWSPQISAIEDPTLYTAQFNETPRPYPVTLPEQPTGYTITHEGSTTVGYGQTFTFDVNILEGYVKTKHFVVRANDTLLEPNEEGHYQALVSGDTEIFVAGVEEVTHQTVHADEELTIENGQWKTISETECLTVNGTLIVEGILTIEGTLINNGTIICEGLISNEEGTLVNNGTVNVNIGSAYNGNKPVNQRLSYQVGWDTDGASGLDDWTYVLDGDEPVHADGIKESDVEYNYTFENWIPNLNPVTGPTQYMASFTVETRSYDVTLPESQVGYTISYNGSTTVRYGQTFTFAVTMSNGYMQSRDFAVKANGKELTPTGGQYTTTITGPITITVEGVYAIYYQTIGADEEQTVTDRLVITEREWLTVEGTLIVEGTLAVQGTLENNGTIICKGTIVALPDATTINTGKIYMNYGSDITGIEPDNLLYQIGWDTDGDGEVNEEAYLLHGTTLEHADPSKEQTVDKVYTFTGWDPAIGDDTKAMAPTIYTAQFSEAPRQYQVDLPADVERIGYTITPGDSSLVNYGQDFTFTVDVNEGYMESKDFVVKANGIPLKPIDGRYQVNVTGNITITVEGVKEIVHITEDDFVPDDDGRYTIEENEVVTVDGELVVDGTLDIQGTLVNNGTIICNGTITNHGSFTNTGAIHMNEGSEFIGEKPDHLYYQTKWDIDGNGTIDEITYELHGQTPKPEPGNKPMTVDTVYTFTGWNPGLMAAGAPTTYTAQFSESMRFYPISLPNDRVGYTIKTDDSLSIGYDETFTFTIEIQNGYMKTKDFAVMANDVVLTPNADGNYEVIVHGDTKITITGIKVVNQPSTADYSDMTLWQWLFAISCLLLIGSQLLTKKKYHA